MSLGHDPTVVPAISAEDRSGIVDRLHALNPGVGRDLVDDAVTRAVDRLAGASVEHYLPLLVERLARRELHDRNR